MSDIESFLIDCGFEKTSPDWYDKLGKIYKYPEFIYLDCPYSKGSRFTNLTFRINEDRNAIRITVTINSIEEDSIIYEGFCYSVEFLKLLLQNLFGGDGQTKKDINSYFNNKLYE